MDALRTQPDQVTGLLDAHLGLSPLREEGEAEAIKRAIQTREDRVLFIEDDRRKLVTFRRDGEYEVRQLPEDTEPEAYGRFIEYSLKVAAYLRRQKPDSSFGAYYSLRPLIYGGEYWLDTVTRQEINRCQDTDPPTALNVLMLVLEPGIPVFEVVQSMRKGDRFGYFETLLGVLLPFTTRDEAQIVIDRLHSHFTIPNIHHWELTTEFENHFELQTRVKKLL